MYVYEFLWRGRPGEQPSYHVILADGKDAFGRHVESGVLSPAQAEAQGFPLAAVIENINAATLVARDQAVADKATAEGERDSALQALDAVQRELDTLRAEETR